MCVFFWTLLGEVHRNVFLQKLNQYGCHWKTFSQTIPIFNYRPRTLESFSLPFIFNKTLHKLSLYCRQCPRTQTVLFELRAHAFEKRVSPAAVRSQSIFAESRQKVNRPDDFRRSVVPVASGVCGTGSVTPPVEVFIKKTGSYR